MRTLADVALGPAAFAEAFAAGQQMTLEQALLVLQESMR